MSRTATGVTLLVIGAILTFALQVNIPGLGEYALGVILMLAGALILILGYVLDQQRRRPHTVVEERPVVDERPHTEREVTERDVVEERPVQRRRRRL
jgi:uncharacterized membrane protein